MSITVATVATKLVAIHKEYQEQGGFGDAAKITASSRPLGGLEGFESDLIPEIVRRLARELGHPLGQSVRVKNIYAEKGEKLSISNISQRFFDLYVPKDAN